MNIIPFLADAATKAVATSAPTTAHAVKTVGKTPVPEWYNLINNPMLLPIAAIAVLFLFMGRNKGGKEEKQRKEALKQLKRGDRVQTIGGIQGAVVRAEETRVEVKVDESTNTKMWFARSAIARVIEASKSEVK